MYTATHGLGISVNLVQQPNTANGFSGQVTEDDYDLNQHERERVIELLLSQERVIALLYDKTFAMTSMEAPPPDMPIPMADIKTNNMIGEEGEEGEENEHEDESQFEQQHQA